MSTHTSASPRTASRNWLMAVAFPRRTGSTMSRTLSSRAVRSRAAATLPSVLPLETTTIDRTSTPGPRTRPGASSRRPRFSASL